MEGRGPETHDVCRLCRVYLQRRKIVHSRNFLHGCKHEFQAVDFVVTVICCVASALCVSHCEMK